MPGPTSTDRKRKQPFRGKDGKPNRKSQKRLEARQKEIPSSGYYTIGLKTGYFHKPGSQQR